MKYLYLVIVLLTRRNGLLDLDFWRAQRIAFIIGLTKNILYYTKLWNMNTFFIRNFELLGDRNDSTSCT
jgi:hypothetical protein